MPRRGSSIDDGTVNVVGVLRGLRSRESLHQRRQTRTSSPATTPSTPPAADLSDGDTSTDADGAESAADATAMRRRAWAMATCRTGATCPTGATLPDGVTPPAGDPGRKHERAPAERRHARQRVREGGAGGMGMGDENCLIQINGGYTVLDAAGDGVDSNGIVSRSRAACCWSTAPRAAATAPSTTTSTATVTGGTVRHGGLDRHGAELHERRAALRRSTHGERQRRPERGRRGRRQARWWPR